MKVQVVRATVLPDDREAYLEAWDDWSGTLFTMGVRTELLEHGERRDEFVELTWLEAGEEAALADDRLVRIQARLDAAAELRQGALELYRRVRRGSAGGPNGPASRPVPGT